METEPGPFGFPEQSQTSSNSKMSFADMISSWLENDEIYTPTFPEDQLRSNIQMLEDNSLQFGASYFDQTDPFSLIPGQNDCDNSFLLELSNFHVKPTTDSGVCNSLPPGISVTEEPTIQLDSFVQGDDGDCFLKDEICLGAAPAESQDSLFGYAPGSASTSTTNSYEMNLMINAGRTEEEEEEEEEEDEENEDDNYPKSGSLNCKNLVSERNRRKRLSKQLLALRSLVPNITKMDKRSVLVDALSYLKSIHEEIACLQAELKEKERSSSSSSSRNKQSNVIQPCPDTESNPDMTPRSSSKRKPQILEIDTEKIEDRRFVVKITCKGRGGEGVGGDLLRVIESLGLEITYTALEHIKPSLVLTTVFIRVRKQGRMTEEKLKYSITSTALKSGLKLENP